MATSRSKYLYILLLNLFSIISIAFCDISFNWDPDLHERRPQDESQQTSKARTSSMLAARGHLLESANKLQLNLSDPIDRLLSDVLDRNSPDMKPSRDYKDFTDISLNVSKRAWSLLHDKTQIALLESLHLAEPAIREVLTSANVSSGCLKSLDEIIDGVMRMESWAIKLIASWGKFPPTGLFEGTYSDVGDYYTCVDIPNNNFIGHAHYCSLSFRPVMASRKDYELILKKVPEELSAQFMSNSTSTPSLWPTSRSKDAFVDILDQAQYFHYVYFKIATCWPIQCTPFDIRRVAKLIAKRYVLMTGPVKCFSEYSDDYEQAGSVEVKLANGSEPIKRKLSISTWDLNDGIYIWKPHFNNGQKIALYVIGSISFFVFLMTLIDIFVNRIPKLRDAIRCMLSDHTEASDRHSSGNGTLTMGRFSTDCEENATEARVSNLQQSQANNIYHPKYLAVSTCDQANEQRVSHDGCRAEFREDSITRDRCLLMTIVENSSIISSCSEFFSITETQMKNIMCLDGIRCVTMAWIITTHTMMYNEWSAFARTRHIEKAVTSLISQPIFNGSYLVDSFFLMSGLLSAYTAFRQCKGLATKFNSIAYIINRWLRLTPQVLFISMLLIILPAASDGPHWFPLVGEYSENCLENWWINAVHLQAFYKTEKMCNFVTWWISIDFFYHFFAVVIIWALLLAGHKTGFTALALVVTGHVAWQAVRHFQLNLPPNVFSTIPQTGAMWSQMTMGFYWTPYSHSVPFFFGFYLGYLLALKKDLIKKSLNWRRAAIGWFVISICFFGQGYSTFLWITGQADYPRLLSTVFHIICPFIWATSLCWVIVACHNGYGGFINSFLTNRLFIILGRASYLVYLSHFQVMFLFFGNQNVLLEPSTLVMFYVILGNICLSSIYGSFLCIVFELPWLKAQKRIAQMLR